ncbi:S1C family serine protease [Pedobacter frigoris]|uniref:PDZ domain-containing protein n=1 Tax=Pedobacter frigoris TaxID=2571272 RepID=A0A4U1CGD8_9SPHI|nr:trypsin-like peptidase domain-containing protein [Pedobacter frigoris]TKC06218.1 PDZ domain-containing protein [Pedobacter frigoris]
MRRLLLILMLLQVCTQGFTQKFDARRLENEVKQTGQKAFASAVLIKPYDTLSKRVLSGMFSGVVVDAEGYILSAAHAVRPDRIYQIYFPDGKTFLAKGLGRIPANDAAVLKIIEKGVWPFAEMGWSGSLKKYEPCISIAYPGSLPQLKPTLRFGYVVDKNAKNGFIQTTCLMEPGDSGGPVFDLQGRVIGLHSQIELGLDGNFEIAVDLYRKYWKALTVAKSYSELPSADSLTADPMAGKLNSISGLENMNDNFSKLEYVMERSSFTVKSQLDGKEITVLGTVFNAEHFADKSVTRDKSFLVSKSSMVGDTPLVVIKADKIISARIIKRDEANDLVLLEINGKIKNGVDLNAKKDSIGFNEIGRFLISPHPDNSGQISVLGNTGVNIKSVPNSGFLGVTTELKDGQIVLTTLQRRSPASLAMLRVGDQLLSVNGKSIQDPEDLVNEIQKFKPQQKVKLQIKRGEEEFIKDITLASRLNVRTHIADQFTDGKSDRRFGFDKVFVHDSKLKPSECGGPVFDMDGIFYGVNIARFSRTSSIAVPTNIVADFVKRSLKTGDAKTQISEL